MEPKLFQFSSYPDPLWVRGSLCDNPDCECGEVFIYLLENDEASRYSLGRPVLALRIDTATWRESESPARPASLDGLAEDFLREYPPAKRAAWQAEVARKRQVARRLRDYRLDAQAMGSGKLIAFGDILSDRGSISSGGVSLAFQIEHGGTVYLVDDLYCSNPDCPCKEVHLAFFRCKRSPEAGRVTSAEECFVARLSLEGHLESVECHRGTRGQASAVLKAWRSSPEFDRDLKDFEWRSAKVKEIANRGCSKRGPLHPSEDWVPPPVERLNRPPRVGRNEPCPCGSGKKYKKCCGKATG